MLAPQSQEIYYPESDGKPMAETDLHRNLLLKLVDSLQCAFPEAYVSGNICLYYEEGNPRKMISPDALLCLSHPPEEKRVYLSWEENHQLDLVMEFSSQSTYREDHFKKLRIYEQILKVPYYVIFNPIRIYLNVFSLVNGQYVMQETDQRGLYTLKKLGIRIGIENFNSLRLYDQEGQPIPTSVEAERQQKEEERRQKEEERRQKEEERRQKEEERRQKEEERRQKEEERRQKEEERRQKEEERRQKEEERRQKEEERRQKEEERRQKEEERRQKEEERRLKEEEQRQKEEERRQKDEALAEIERLRSLMKAAGIDHK
ncbi:Uma2 family endonuclease [Deltaproteobacteria bacterium TL4]